MLYQFLFSCLCFWIFFGDPTEQYSIYRPQIMKKEFEESIEDVRMHGNSSTFTQGKCLLCTVLEMVKKTCIYLRIETPQICEGTVDIFGREVTTVLSQIDISPEDLCYLAFPDRCSISSLSSVPAEDWNVWLPEHTEATKTCPTTPESKDILKVLHLSDIHLDRKYSPGSDAKCGKPICCRGPPLRYSYATPKQNKTIFSIVSELLPKHEKEDELPGAGKWGDYRQCDLPSWTFENLLETVSRGSLRDHYEAPSELSDFPLRKIDYIIWTGDATSHDVWEQNEETVKDTLTYLTDTIRRYFPSTLVFPVVGNHDSFPPNSFPLFAAKQDEGKSDMWIYDALAATWSEWLSEDALETVRRGAYYSTLVRPGFRIVSLNTNFCYSENWWLYLNSEDPSGMLAWFVQVLIQAENAGEKVHVIGHVPPGRSPDCLKAWSRNYYRIVERFKCIITGQFYGHTHFDELELFYSEADSEPFSVAYLAPSVTPYTDMNPAFRVYDIASGGSWPVVNFRTYDLDLHDANLYDRPIWKLEYEAKEAYNLSNLSPIEWGRVLQSWKRYFEGNIYSRPPPTLTRYLQFYSRGRFHESMHHINSGNANLPCEDMNCALKVVCDIIKPQRWEICHGQQQELLL